MSSSKKIDQIVPRETTKGENLLCNSYDLKGVTEKSSLAFKRFLFECVGWVYM